jgi:Ras-related protein Rab-1A
MTEKPKDEQIIAYKLALLGDAQVGKTAFFKKLLGGGFKPSVSTIGIDAKTLNLDDIEVNINNKLEKKSFHISLYDTAGQERYRSITKSYMNKADGIILMYDITERESFDHIESWLESISEILSDWKSEKYFIVLLGNKTDLAANDENLDDQDKKRKVTYEEGKQKAEENEVFWLGEISVKDIPFEELKKLFNNIVVKTFDKVGVKLLKKNTEIKPVKKKKKGFC